jgi:hypothetical protein
MQALSSALLARRKLLSWLTCAAVLQIWTLLEKLLAKLQIGALQLTPVPSSIPAGQMQRLMEIAHEVYQEPKWDIPTRQSALP